MRMRFVVAWAVMSLCACASQAALFHSYNLDENPINGTATPYANKTTANDSTGTMHGKYVGSTSSTTGIWGIPNTAAHFDGGSASEVVNNSAPVLCTLSNYAVECFFQIDAGYNSAERFIYAESGGPGPVLLLRLMPDGTVQFGNHNGSSWAFLNTASITFQPGRWYFVAGVLNSTSGTGPTQGAKLYVYDDTNTLIGSAINSSNQHHTGGGVVKATIGAWDPATLNTVTPTSAFLGTIDNVKLYNTARTAAEVSADAVIPEPAAIGIIACALLPLRRCQRALRP